MCVRRGSAARPWRTERVIVASCSGWWRRARGVRGGSCLTGEGCQRQQARRGGGLGIYFWRSGAVGEGAAWRSGGRCSRITTYEEASLRLLESRCTLERGGPGWGTGCSWGNLLSPARATRFPVSMRRYACRLTPGRHGSRKRLMPRIIRVRTIREKLSSVVHKRFN